MGIQIFTELLGEVDDFRLNGDSLEITAPRFEVFLDQQDIGFEVFDTEASGLGHTPNFFNDLDSSQSDAVEIQSSVSGCSCCACAALKKDLYIVQPDTDGFGSDGGFTGDFSGIEFGKTDFGDGRLFVDIPANTSTTASVDVNGSFSDTLEVSNDQDWIKVELVAGQRYLIAMDRNPANGNALEDPLVRLLDSNGVEITQNDDGGGDRESLISYTADTTGTYFISAQAWQDSAGNTSTGDYTVSVTEAAPLAERDIDGIAHFLTDEFDNPEHYNVTTITYDVSSLSAGAQALAERALQAWADVTPLSFVSDTSGNAMIKFQDTESGAYNSNTTLNGIIQSSQLNVSSNWNQGNLAVDSYTYQTFIHEIGHSLGLGHAGPYNGSATYGIDNIYLNDSWAYSVMSYMDQQESGYFGDSRFVLGPQIADILAVQNVYGVNTTTRTGDTVYGFNSTETDVHDFSQFTRAPSLSIWDAGGDDTLDFSGYSDDQRINLNQETFSDVGGIRGVISIARGVVIEDAIGGTGDDFLIGNEVVNLLQGGDGDDKLSGGLGADILNGGVGSDTASYEFAMTAVNVNLADGTRIGDDAVGDVFVSIENLMGSNYGDTLYGDGDNNTLSGGRNDDILAGRNGNDVLNGGEGVDYAIYFGTSFSDYTITQNANGSYTVVDNGTGIDGTDTLIDVEFIRVNGQDFALNSAAILLTANMDNYVGTGNADEIFGFEGDDIILAKDGDDIVYGGAGDDELRGSGGIDRLFGGDGNDNLFGGSGGDFLDGGEGLDYVNFRLGSSGLTVDLANNSNNTGVAAGDTYVSIEAVLGTVYGDTIYGDDGDNELRGLFGDDIIHAGAGNDRVFDGRGDDQIFLEAGDDIAEVKIGANTYDGGEGNDTISYFYAKDSSGVTIDLATQTSSGGWADDDTFTNFENAYGTVLYDDTLNGSTGDNVLRGFGGDDLLFGHGGNDLLVGGDGIDTARYLGASLSDYTIVNDGNGHFTITHNNGGIDGTDTLVDIEFIRINGTDYDLNNLPSSQDATPATNKAVIAEPVVDTTPKEVVSELPELTLSQDEIAAYLDEAEAYAKDYDYLGGRSIESALDGEFGALDGLNDLYHIA